MAIGTTAAILGASALGVGGSLLAGSKQASAAKKAANVQKEAAEQQVQAFRDAAYQGRTDQLPWLQQGIQALYTLSDELGIPRPENFTLPTAENNVLRGAEGATASGGAAGVVTPTAAAGGTATTAFTPRSGFRETPGYQFALEQGMKANNNRLAQLGLSDSGAAQKETLRFATGLADQTYQTYLNRVSSLAGGGAQTASGLAGIGLNAAQGVGNALGQAGAAQASGIVGAANAFTNTVGNATQSLGQGFGALAMSGQPSNNLFGVRY